MSLHLYALIEFGRALICSILNLIIQVSLQVFDITLPFELLEHERLCSLLWSESRLASFVGSSIVGTFQLSFSFFGHLSMEHIIYEQFVLLVFQCLQFVEFVRFFLIRFVILECFLVFFLLFLEIAFKSGSCLFQGSVFELLADGFGIYCFVGLEIEWCTLLELLTKRYFTETTLWVYAYVLYHMGIKLNKSMLSIIFCASNFITFLLL